MDIVDHDETSADKVLQFRKEGRHALGGVDDDEGDRKVVGEAEDAAGVEVATAEPLDFAED